jgi:hypothetical protein
MGVLASLRNLVSWKLLQLAEKEAELTKLLRERSLVAS